MKHQSKLPHIGTTIFSVMSALATKHHAINLSQGFPNFKSDEQLKHLVTKAMASGYNQYAPMPGNMELREAIANKINVLYNATYNPESDITITAGATQAIYTIISTFVRQNDEVIIFKPAYDCYEPAVEINGGKTVAIQLEAPYYKIDWHHVKTHFSSKTKMIIINTPQNPTGSVFLEEDLLALQALTKDTNCIVLSDEVYEHIIFDGLPHQSVCKYPELKTRSFITASFGKIFHNTGWKVGYCCSPKELMDEFRKVHQFNVFSVNHPMQKALADYLKESKHYETLSPFYQEKRDLFLNLIAPSRFKAIPAKGTYFQGLDFSEISQDKDVDFAKQLTIKHGLAAIPLSVFNHNNKDDKMLRFCFAKTKDTLVQAAEILNRI